MPAAPLGAWLAEGFAGHVGTLGDTSAPHALLGLWGTGDLRLVSGSYGPAGLTVPVDESKDLAETRALIDHCLDLPSQGLGRHERSLLEVARV